MKLHLHIGPKKTGTTSIQRYLLRTIGSPEPQPTWYPSSDARGPGHAAMALSFLAGNTDSAVALLEKARSNAVKNLIISSENFETAYRDRSRIDDLADVFGGKNTHLLITLNSFSARYASAWQESLKHGFAMPPLEEAFLGVVRRPGFRPDFCIVFAETLRVSQVSIICSRRRGPTNDLLQNAVAALGLPFSPDHEIRENVRIGRVETEILRAMNKVLFEAGVDPSDSTPLRALAFRMFESEKWCAHRPHVGLDTPEYIAKRLSSIAGQAIRNVEKLKENFDVRVFGELDWLRET